MGPRFEHKIHVLGFSWRNGYDLFHGPQLFVPSFHGVFTGRQITQIVVSVHAGDCEERMLEHCDVATHPRMHVALDGNCDLLPREGFSWGRARGWGFIPFTFVIGTA